MRWLAVLAVLAVIVVPPVIVWRRLRTEIQG